MKTLQLAPRQPRARGPSTSAPTSGDGRLKNLGERVSVLLIDDDSMERLVCSKMLFRLGGDAVDVHECETAEEGLKYLEVAHASCILLDLSLPVLDGYGFLERLRQRNEDTPPVIVLSGHGPEAGLEALKSGALEYLNKDRLTPDSLERAICFVLEKERTKKMRRRLDVSERAAAIGSLAAGVAHEINNPAAYVSANLEVMARIMRKVRSLELTAHTERNDFLTQLEQLIDESADGVQRIAAIVGDLRQFTNVSPQSVQATNLNQVVRAALRLFRQRQPKNLRLDLNLLSRSVVLADENKLVQVVLNLLSNAVDAAPSSKPQVLVGTRETQEQLILEVEDNGPGIAPAKRQRIFAPFFTTKVSSKGSGLGLALCIEYAKRHKGTLEVDRSALGGALLRLTIPTQKKDHPQDTQEPLPIRREPARCRVLVIDDEPIILRSVVRLMSERHHVSTAADWHEASELLVKNEFDVVLCDMTLGEVRGTDIYRRIIERCPPLAEKFVFWSGGEISAIERGTIERWGCQLLIKPVRFAEIQLAIAQIRPQESN